MVAGAPGIQADHRRPCRTRASRSACSRCRRSTRAPWADSLTNTGNGFQVLSSDQNKKAAGAFLAFLQQPENLAKLYAATGNLPVEHELGRRPSRTRSTRQHAGVAGRTSDVVVDRATYTPVDLDVNGTFVVWQKMMAGEIDVDGAVALYQDVLDTWTEANGRGARELPDVGRRLSESATTLSAGRGRHRAPGRGQRRPRRDGAVPWLFVAPLVLVVLARLRVPDAVADPLLVQQVGIGHAVPSEWVGAAATTSTSSRTTTSTGGR